MSLVPMLFSNWWEELDRPQRRNVQNFGHDLSLEDLLDTVPSSDQIMIFRPGRSFLRKRYHPYINSHRKSCSINSSVVDADKDKFKVTLDVQQFEPNEIKVKVVDRNIVVEAKHEEKEDEHGWISRQFLRKYMIPNECNVEKVESFLSSDGVLTLTVPRKQDPTDSNERRVQIQFTGQPAIRESVTNGSVTNNNNQEHAQNQKVPNTPQRGRKAANKTT